MKSLYNIIAASLIVTAFGAASALAANHAMSGNYSLDISKSVGNCPSAAMIQDFDRDTFYTDLLPNETKYQIIGRSIYPRTEEMFKEGKLLSATKYVQNRFYKNPTGTGYDQLFTSFEVSLKQNRLTAILKNRPLQPRPDMTKPIQLTFRCVFNKVQ